MRSPEYCRRKFKRKGQTRDIISASGKVKENGEKDAIKGHTAKRAQRDGSWCRGKEYEVRERRGRRRDSKNLLHYNSV